MVYQKFQGMQCALRILLDSIGDQKISQAELKIVLQFLRIFMI